MWPVHYADVYQRGGMKQHGACWLLGVWLFAWASCLPADTPGDEAQTLHLPAQAPATTALSLDIYAALDMPQARPLLKAFHQRYPQIEVRYRNMTTLSLYESFLRKPRRADVVISSAMPWQFSLANDGYARALSKDVLAHWPARAHWRRELVAFTFEPIAMVYNKKLLTLAEPPRNHAELLALLDAQEKALTGRIATYDPARSGAGYSYAMAESRLSPRYWDLIAALGRVETELNTTTAQTLQGLTDGRYWLGYNLLGSYARAFVEKHAELEMVIPDDYALVVQRLAFMSAQAPHPEAARLFMGFLVSEEGQRIIAEQTTLGAIHPDVTGAGSAAELRAGSGGSMRPAELDPQLLAALDRLKRRALLSRWKREFHQAKHSVPAEK